MGSLKPFRVLSTLETDWSLLRNDCQPARSLLTSALPPSIEHLTLIPNPDSGSLLDISVTALHNLMASKKLDFEMVQTVTLNYTNLLPTVQIWLLQKALGSGVKLEIDRREDPDTKRKAFLELRYDLPSPHSHRSGLDRITLMVYDTQGPSRSSI